MRKLLILFLLITQHFSYAQEIKFTSETINMQRNNYLKLSENEFLIAVTNDDGSDCNLIKMNKTCNSVWSIPNIKGFMGAANFKNNILVFSTGNDGAELTSTVHAMLVSNAQGKVIAQKDIPVFTNKQSTDFYILSDSSDNFQCLLMRTTELEKTQKYVNFKYLQTEGYTDNLQAVSFDESLNVKTTVLNSAQLQKAQFISCICNNNGDIFLASVQDNVLSVNRYNAGASETSASVTAKTNFDEEVITEESFIKLRQNSVAFSCAFEEQKKDDRTLISGIFNFDKNKSFIQEDLIDKDYSKQYTRNRNGKIHIIGIDFYKDNFITIKEGSTWESIPGKSEMYFTYKPLLIEFYDYNMHKTTELLGNEDLRIVEGFSTSGYKILNNKLYLFYNSNKGMGIHPKYQIINLDNPTIDKEVEFGESKINSALYGPGIIWFKDIALMPFLSHESMFNSRKFSTTFRGIEFK